MFYFFIMAFYVLDVVHRIQKFIVDSSFSLRNLGINCLIFMQTLMDFLWKSVDAQREGLTIIVNKEERVVIGGGKTREKIYTLSVKECGGCEEVIGGLKASEDLKDI
jgi:hypothetical protein